MFSSISALIVILIIIPYCIGLLPASFVSKRLRNMPTTYIFGFVMSLGLFELVSVPITILKDDGFPLIVAVYLGVESAFAMIGLIVYNFVVYKFEAQGDSEHKPHMPHKPDLRHRIHKGDVKKGFKLKIDEEHVLWTVVVISILFQVVMFVLMQSFDGDDAYYVVQSVLTEQTNTLYRIKPYTGLSMSMDLRHALASVPVWIAFLGRVSGIHPTIIAHSVIGILLIPLLYIVYYNYAVALFGTDSRRKAAFMLFVSFMYIFGNVSIYTQATFMLTRTWQGKSMLANLILITIGWIMMVLFKREEDSDELTLGFWIVMCFLSIAAAMCSTASVFLVALMIAVYGITLSICKKDVQVALKLMITCVPLVAYGAMYILI